VAWDRMDRSSLYGAPASPLSSVVRGEVRALSSGSRHQVGVFEAPFSAPGWGRAVCLNASRTHINSSRRYHSVARPYVAAGVSRGVPLGLPPAGQAARLSRWRAEAKAVTTSSLLHGSGDMVMK
jgi:hypothetical protein